MEWRREKPKEPGFYEYRGDLQPSYAGAVPTNCDPSCVVHVDSDGEMGLTLRSGLDQYDLESTDGLWRGPIVEQST